MSLPITNGHRFTALRELLGQTQGQLAERLGVAQPVVSMIEKASRPLSLELAEKAASEFSLPLAFFFVPPSTLDVAHPTFRKHSAARAADERRVVRLYREAARAFAAASETSGYHTQGLPDSLAESDPETAAVHVRAAAGVSSLAPILNMTRLLERLGFGVVTNLDPERPTDDPRHSGVSIPSVGSSRPLIALAKSMNGQDQRITLAHELGHHIWDRSFSQVWKSTRSPEERRAFDFAGALLIPRDVITSRVTETLNLVGYLPIKAEFGVGVDAIVMRAKKLGVISSDRARSLFIQLSARGWRKQEPVEVAQERPLLFGQSVERAVGLTQDAVEDFTALPAPIVFPWLGRDPEPEPVVDLAAWRASRAAK